MTKAVLVKVSVFKGTVQYVSKDSKGELVRGPVFVATQQEWARAADQLLEPLKQTCPAPVRHGQDEYHCTVCNVIWGVDEPRPPCDT